MCVSTDRVEQHLTDVLPVAVLQTGSTELTFGPHAVAAATHCLGVQRLLPALVTRAALEGEKKQPKKARQNTFLRLYIHVFGLSLGAYFCFLANSFCTAHPDQFLAAVQLLFHNVVTHVLLVPDLVFAAVRDVLQVLFRDLVH